MKTIDPTGTTEVELTQTYNSTNKPKREPPSKGSYLKQFSNALAIKLAIAYTDGNQYLLADVKR